MGNVFESFASGLGHAIGSIFHAPVDFLSGKNCSSLCGPIWDLTCYIENFCIANLLKLGLILVVVYMVLLFIYLTYKLRVFHCLFCCVFKTIWTCCSTCGHCCHCLFHELSSVRRRPRRAHIMEGSSIPRGKNVSLQRWNRTRRRQGRGYVIRRSLRPKNNRAGIGIRGKYEQRGRKQRGAKNGYGVRVTRTTRFAHKRTASTFSR